MNPFRVLSRRHALWIVAIAAMGLVACSGPCRDNDADEIRLQEAAGMQAAANRTPAPTSTATASATVAATSTAAASASATTSGTAAGGAGTATAGQAVRLRATFGVDHPPFAQNYGVGGNSVGLACISGIPTNGLVTITLGGGTGAPPTIVGSGGADGSVIIPFPIQQFGTMNGSITSLRVNGQPANFQADPFSYTVGAPDLICTPPR